ncbi:potassium-transporting ATPase subunit KdpA [Escherichia coli]|nr:potassium-transporting ATPase subunit KdpA [Escherichia coli]
MAAQGFLLIATFLLVLMVLARPLGSGLARLINDIPLPGTTGVERVLFSALGVSDREMNWKQYLSAILGLNILGLAVLFFMLLGQHYLPLNPQQLPGLSWDLALNTAVSFVTNTNWQSYSGETTLSYFSQMAGLTVQNFLSAASGIAVIFVICVGVVMWAEVQGNPHLLALGADSSINMEGKESRFGVLVSSLFAVVTTAASCGAVIAMHDSFTALGGMVPMWLMQIGEVVFGGVGSGLYGMMLFVLLAVFIAGLMIGRTPEYLGKKIDVREMKLTALAILVTPTLVLMGAALAMMTDAGRSAMLNPGPHGFSEVLYAVSSAANNNGSAFAGLSANSPFWNCLLALCMFVGRFGVIIPVMAIAGSLVSKKSQPASSGTLPTHGPLFVGLLIGTVLLVGALTFIPALALGPVAEYLS